MTDLTAGKTVALISCVARKQNRSAEAKELYQSQWFNLARQYVESKAIPWFILSPKNGLVAPETVLSPYERALSNMSTYEQQTWAATVFSQIQAAISPTCPLQLFAGQGYQALLIPRLKQGGYDIEIPLASQGIGQQLTWFKQALQSATTSH